MKFCGSYRSGDVEFLLKRLVDMPFHDVATKETLIQTGARHYSEMLSPESLPSEAYLSLFREACEANWHQMAKDCLTLASMIAERRVGSITLVSLARAGTPVGVILNHLLQKVSKREVIHYSISIIRDRGIDEVALHHILDQGHLPESIVFIDGWTGKGVISGVLEVAIKAFNEKNEISIDSGLYVLSDLAGTAAFAASYLDYLIPSSILNATVSGLVSRSILNDTIKSNEFHGCVYYENFEPHDLSVEFAQRVISDGIELAKSGIHHHKMSINRSNVAEISEKYLANTMSNYGISDINHIKPGIGEATRVLLRRVPKYLILRDMHATSVAHLKILAKEKCVPIIIDLHLPYQAVSIIGQNIDG